MTLDPNDPTTAAGIAAAEAVAAAAAPFVPGGPLADALLVQGLNFWASFAANKAAGTLTDAQMQAAMNAAGDKATTDLAQLMADYNAQQAAAT